MKFGRGTASRKALAMLGCCTLVVAACGSDDDGGGDAATTSAASGGESTTSGEATTTAGGDDTEPAGTEPDSTESAPTEPDSTESGDTEPDATEPDSTDGGGSTPTGSAGCPEIDDSLDEAGGTGAGRLLSDLECAAASPLAAEGEPIIIGLQNPEGDPPAASRSTRLAATAAVDYINNELGGLGAGHPERRARPADPAGDLQDRHRPGRLAALRQRAGQQAAVHWSSRRSTSSATTSRSSKRPAFRPS